QSPAGAVAAGRARAAPAVSTRLGPTVGPSRAERPPRSPIRSPAGPALAHRLQPRLLLGGQDFPQSRIDVPLQVRQLLLLLGGELQLVAQIIGEHLARLRRAAGAAGTARPAPAGTLAAATRGSTFSPAPGDQLFPRDHSVLLP